MLEHDWKAYLGQMSQMMQRAHNARDLISIESFLLDRGSYFPRWTEPNEHMEMKQCYPNCAQYALRHDLLYCEGIASSVIPVNHAWCYDPDTRLVHDPTWWPLDHHHDGKHDAPTYYGVAIGAADLWDHIAATDHYSIFDSDWHSDFAVLRGKTLLPFVELV